MKDSLQTYYDKNNGRLPTEPIPKEIVKSVPFDMNDIVLPYSPCNSCTYQPPWSYSNECEKCEDFDRYDDGDLE